MTLSTDVIKEFMKVTNNEDQKKFLEDGRKVLITICCKLKLRYNLDAIHERNPKNALSPEFHGKFPTLDHVLS